MTLYPSELILSFPGAYPYYRMVMLCRAEMRLTELADGAETGQSGTDGHTRETRFGDGSLHVSTAIIIPPSPSVRKSCHCYICEMEGG